jgi:tetratricopeptide (TPR) repeat protein
LVYRDSRFVVFVKNSDENAGIIEKYWSQASQDEVGQLYNNYLAEQFNSVGLDLIKKAKSMNDVIDAARYFENAVDLIPSNILFRLNLAKGLSDLGWWNESRVQYEEILTLDPENQQAKASIEWVNQMEKINAVPRAKRL